MRSLVFLYNPSSLTYTLSQGHIETQSFKGTYPQLLKKNPLLIPLLWPSVATNNA